MIDAVVRIRAGARLQWWQQALVAGWAALVLVAIFVRGRQLEIDQQVSNRIRYNAMPVAVSVLYHGRSLDYTAFKTVAIGFQTDGTVDSRIVWALRHPPQPDDQTYYWAADDRGMADYVIAAFILFGPHTDSLYKFYFVVLGVSVLLFLLDLGWHAAAGATMFFALAAIYTCLAVIPLGNLTVALFEPGSLFEPRLIELLSFVAALHLGVTAFVSARWSLARFAIVFAQAVVLAECYHGRSSVGWEVLFVLLAGTGAWFLPREAVRNPRSVNGSPAASIRRAIPWPVVCLVVVLVSLACYKQYAYNPRYFQDMGARTVWHNSLMGLGLNRSLNEKYKLGIGDAIIVDSVIEYLQNSHDPRLTREWTSRNILDSLGGHFVFNWFVYEQAARDFYWHLWRTETRSMLHVYLIDKPRDMGHVILKTMRSDPEPWRNLRGLYFRPFAAGGLLVILPGLLIAGVRHPSISPLLAVSLMLLVCSLIPGLLFYPVVHTMIGVFASLSLALYLAAASIVATVCRHLPGFTLYDQPAA